MTRRIWNDSRAILRASLYEGRLKTKFVSEPVMVLKGSAILLVDHL